MQQQPSLGRTSATTVDTEAAYGQVGICIGKGTNEAMELVDSPRVVTPVVWVHGNPGPFGLLCFGMTTCTLMFMVTGWVPGAFNHVAVGYIAMFGGFGQLVAGFLELVKGNTFAGTAFSSYGCFWMGYAFYKQLEMNGVVESMSVQARAGDALYHGLWGFLTLAFYGVTLRKNGGLQAVFGPIVIAFWLLAASTYSPQAKVAAGYFGLLGGGSAIYTAIAMLYQDELGISLPGMRPTNYI